MRILKSVPVAFGILLAAAVALAGETKRPEEDWTGTTQVSGRHSKAELEAMAKISMVDAEKAALASIEPAAAVKKVKERELEVERGYLVYSFDIAIAGRKGIEEVIVDAGSGKVLAHEQE